MNLSSIAWRRGRCRLTAAKAGIVGLTNALARAFGSDNIRVTRSAQRGDRSAEARNFKDARINRCDCPASIHQDDAARRDMRGWRCFFALRQPNGYQAVDHCRRGASMNEIAKALQPEARGQTFAFGLNPYGLTYHLGLQGAGGPRANLKGAGLEGFIAIATELGAKVLEIYDPWLRAMSDDEIRALRDRLGDLGMTPIVSSGLMMGPFESALRSARILNAEVIRHGLTTVCAAIVALGDKWKELVAEFAPRSRARSRTADEGQSWRSKTTRTGGDNSRILRNDPRPRHLSRYRKPTRSPSAAHFVPMSLRTCGRASEDYRVQFTDEGYRLVRCAIGEAPSFCPRAGHSGGQGRKLNAVLGGARSAPRALCGRSGGASTPPSQHPRSPPASPRRGQSPRR